MASTLDKVKVTINKKDIGIVDGTDRDIYVLWSLSSTNYTKHRSHVSGYKVEWLYFTGDTTAKEKLAIWMVGNTSTVEFQATVDEDGNYYQTATYTPPENARAVKVRITPESKDKTTYKGKKKVTGKHFKGVSNEAELDIVSETHPDAPAVPNISDLTVSITGNSLLAQLTTYDTKAKYIQFQVIKNNTKSVHTAIVKIKRNLASMKCEVAIGGQYKVRVRASALSGTASYDSDPIEIAGSMSLAEAADIVLLVEKTRSKVSEDIADMMFNSPIYTSAWSEYSENYKTIPGNVDDKTVTAEAMAFGSLSGVKVKWSKASNATSYEVEYTMNKDFFDSSPGNVQSVEVTTTEAEITGLDGNQRWYFRVRAKNEQGESAWTKKYATVKVGTRPTAPTTWTVNSTAKLGSIVTLYWTHNSEDGSKQTVAQVQITVGSESTIVIVNAATNHTSINIQSSGNAIVGYGQKETTIKNSLKVEDGSKIKWCVMTKGLIDTYSPWSAVKTVEVYTPPTIDCDLSYGNNLGNNAETPFIMGYYPLNINLEAYPSNRSVLSFSVSITSDKSYTDIDEIGNTITVQAGEELYRNVFNRVSGTSRTGKLSLSPGDINLKDGRTYTITATAAMNNGLTAKTTRKFKLNYTDAVEMFFRCDADVEIDYENLVAYITPVAYKKNDNITTSKFLKMSVYRREYNGSFTLIESDIETLDYPVTIVDPHPSLHYASYRIVAISTRTGTVSFDDTQPIPILHNAIVIQWDEDWQIFYSDADDETATDISTWSGSTLQLPYNVDISAEQKNDVELVGYIGREHPVSYYGTQKSETSHWKAEIPKRDKASLYALRRLANYMGDVYVREPSGLGYWAQVDVSYNIDHVKTVVPVTLSITRVEGGA